MALRKSICGHKRSLQLVIATLMLVCNVAAGSRVSNGVPISGRRPGIILTRNALAEIQRFLFGIIDAPVDPNPGGVAPLPGPLQSPPGYVAPATYNASIFTPPAPVASIQCTPPCLNGGVGQLSSSQGCTCKCPASDNTAGSLFFTGAQCEIPSTICNQFGFYCTHGGRCPASGTGTCACQAPFYGTQCELAGFTCGQVICQNGGKCTLNSQNQQTCTCPAGYSGADCSIFDTKALAATAQTAASTPASNSIIASPSSSSGAKWYYILIGVVGGVALCCVLAVAVFLMRRRRAATRAPSSMKQNSLAKQDSAIQMEEVGSESEVREEGRV